MQGLMMQEKLLISSIIRQAAKLAPQQQIVSRRIENGHSDGAIHRYSYRDCYARTCRLAHALRKLDVQPGDRIGTLAWNGYRHVELYYAISGIGAVVHTINPRLFAQQIEFIVNHAEDSLLFVDLSFVPLLNELADSIPTVKRIVLLCDEAHAPADARFKFTCYESLLDNQPEQFEWPEFDENSAACLCYTSGTTGNPKGVLYSHRSTVIHALASCLPNGLNLSRDTAVLPVVPMYHVSAWGLPYSALIANAKLVLPGAGTDGASLHELIASEDISLMLGVPTVWLNLLDHLDKTGQKLKPGITAGVGGAATPVALVERFRDPHDCYVMPLWGMTETSPLATFGGRSPAVDALPIDERNRVQTSAGRPIFGIELEIFGADNQPVPHDGHQSGELRVRGPWVLQSYFHNDTVACIDGWFDTGDVATVDADGYLRIVDRKKDVIKSGGEWISSIELENAAVGHTSVHEACVIGMPHPKWDERPVLVVVLEEGHQLDPKAITAHLAERVAKWWLPDDIVQIRALPHTATGKLNKVALREIYRKHLASGGGSIVGNG